MHIEKSSRHPKIIGEFGEHQICNLLSRSGLEVARVDHTGMDVLASDLKTGKRLGITVRSRTRMSGREGNAVTLFRPKEGRGALLEACKAFKAEPWLAIYIETEKGADLYLTSLEHYDKQYEGSSNWKMGKQMRDKYQGDPGVDHVSIELHAPRWRWDSQA
jgi:hypothetical protein